MFSGLLVATSTLLMMTALTPRVEYVYTELRRAMVPYEYITQLLADPRTKLMPPPKPAIAEKNKSIDWKKFSKDLTSAQSVERGRVFVAEHRTTLERAETAYGVPKQTIAAVLGIESRFGEYTGGTVAFNLFLSRLVHASPTQWKTDADNLASLVKYCYVTNQDCLDVKGSYAGALGLSQFLPHSIDLWGVDGNQDAVVNLMHPDDAIMSTANFLVAHGFDLHPPRALARYYGSSTGYPAATITYAKAIRRAFEKNPVY